MKESFVLLNNGLLYQKEHLSFKSLAYEAPRLNNDIHNHWPGWNEKVSFAHHVSHWYVVRSSFLLADNFQWLIRADTKFSRTTRYNEQTSWKLHSSWGETWNNECQLFESLHIWCLIVIEISKFSFNPVWSIDISWNCSKDFLLKFRQIFYGFLYIVPIILFSVVYNIPKFLEVQIINITTVLVICIVHCCNSRKPSENSLFVLFQQFVFQLMTTLWQLIFIYPGAKPLPSDDSSQREPHDARESTLRTWVKASTVCWTFRDMIFTKWLPPPWPQVADRYSWSTSEIRDDPLYMTYISANGIGEIKLHHLGMLKLMFHKGCTVKILQQKYWQLLHWQILSNCGPSFLEKN